MYQARLYFDTGFNVVNIPYDRDVLTAAASAIEEYPTMDIITNLFLPNVKLKVSAPMDLKRLGRADFVEIYDQISSSYYSVVDMAPTSADVVTLGLVMEPLLTFNIIDVIGNENGGAFGPDQIGWNGYVERSTHYDRNAIDDQYLQVDPLLVPLSASRHYIYEIFGPGSVSDVNDAGGVYIGWHGPIPGMETINLYGSSYLNTIAAADLNKATAPVKITGTAGENYNVEFSENFNTTRYAIGKPRTEKTSMTVDRATREYPGLTFYGTVDNNNEREGSAPDFLATAQTYYNFGIPNPIAVSYQMPTEFLNQISLAPSGYAIEGYRNGVFSNVVGTSAEFVLDNTVYEYIGTKSGAQGEIVPLNAEFYDEVCHAIALKMRLKLIAAGTGQESVITISDLKPGDTWGALSVKLTTDPSPYGAPYYAWDTRYNNFGYPSSDASGSKSLLEKMYGAVRGATWQPAPVSMSNLGSQNELNAIAIRQTYGAAANTMAYDAAGYQLQLQSNAAGIHAMASAISTATGVYSNASGFSQNFSRAYSDVGASIGDPYGTVNAGGISEAAGRAGGLGLVLGAGGSIANMTATAALSQNQLQSSTASAVYGNAMRQLSLAAEMDVFNASHQANVTDVKFPVSQTLPMFTGNGAIIDIEAPSADDVHRYIEIMQMYGVYVNEYTQRGDHLIPRKADVTNYCFIKTRGLNIQGNGLLSKMAADAAASALNGGVRIWTRHPVMTADTSLYKKEAN